MYIFWKKGSHNKYAREKPIRDKNFGMQVALVLSMLKQDDLEKKLIFLVKQCTEQKKLKKKKLATMLCN